jgi:hypothetical protein
MLTEIIRILVVKCCFSVVKSPMSEQEISIIASVRQPGSLPARLYKRILPVIPLAEADKCLGV